MGIKSTEKIEKPTPIQRHKESIADAFLFDRINTNESEYRAVETPPIIVITVK